MHDKQKDFYNREGKFVFLSGYRQGKALFQAQDLALMASKFTNVKIEAIPSVELRECKDKIKSLESQLAAADELAKLMDGYNHSMHGYDDDCEAWGDNLDDGDGYAPYPEKCTCGLTEIINATEKYKTLRKAGSGKDGGEG